MRGRGPGMTERMTWTKEIDVYLRERLPMTMFAQKRNEKTKRAKRWLRERGLRGTEKNEMKILAQIAEQSMWIALRVTGKSNPAMRILT